MSERSFVLLSGDYVMYDIIVIGGGPAGMTAALYGLRNGKSVLVLEKQGFGGQITYSPKVENYPGTLQMSGNEFADAFMDQIMNQGAELELSEATGIKAGTDSFDITTGDGETYTGKTVIIATGVKHRMLGLPGEEELVGNGISFCAVCDGDFYTGKKVCVAGGGNSALQEAILLSGKCSEVVILQDLPKLTGEKKLQDILCSKDNVIVKTGVKITAVDADEKNFRSVTVQTENGSETIPCDGLFEAIGLIPENDYFSNIADLNKYGYFDSKENCLTKTPGIFVAGDCRSKTVRQVTTACGDGAVAALAACSYIDK